MRPSLILDTVVRVVFPTALLVSLYFLFAGHNQPGGGFVGGLVAGGALALRYVARGAEDAQRALRVGPATLLGLGLTLAALTALVPVVLGDGLLESAKKSFDVPLLGKVPIVSPLFFDAGVYLLVTGMVLLLITTLGNADDVPASDTTEQDGLR